MPRPALALAAAVVAVIVAAATARRVGQAGRKVAVTATPASAPANWSSRSSCATPAAAARCWCVPGAAGVASWPGAASPPPGAHDPRDPRRLARTPHVRAALRAREGVRRGRIVAGEHGHLDPSTIPPEYEPIVDGTGGAVDFRMPFGCGERWRATTYNGHGHALDWNDPMRDDGGRPVLASAAGTVAYRPTPAATASTCWSITEAAGRRCTPICAATRSPTARP